MQAVAHELPGAHKHDHAPSQPIIVQPDMALPRPPQRAPPQTQTFAYTAIPAISLQGDRFVIGDSSTSSQRSWTQLKIVGDGSFGTVALCDWLSPLPPNTPLSPMRVRSEWAGRRLVALKRMRRQWEGGWDECKTLKEIESLRIIPSHPNIIPLYDAFILPSTRELYLVFEAMEGNLYQLIKTRKGKKALAGGLVTSIFFQVASALDHVHDHGYFHRDMKPENLLVTTTGLANYVSTSPNAGPNAPREEDVFVIIKLADFGLARETASRPPYTEYVSTRWYRAPEVLLRSRDYSAPVDMWAFGTIMAELLNLRPLFPGSNELDQLRLINDTLGDPSDAYGFDENGRRRGGGPWRRGHDLGRQLGYQFPRNYPTPLVNYFSDNVPRSLIECIEDLLRYEPDERLTAKQCLQHRFLAETAPGQPKPPPTQPRQRIQRLASPRDEDHDRVHTGIPAVSPRAIPPNHAMSPPDRRPPFPNPAQSFPTQYANQFPNPPNQFPNPNQYNQYNSMPPPRQPVFRQRSHSTSGDSYDPPMEIVEHREGSLPTIPGSLEAYSGEDVEWHKGSYTLEQQAGRSPYAMDMETPAGPSAQPDYSMDVSMSSVNVSKPAGKRSLFGLKKLGSAMFGHSEKLPPVAEANPSGSQTSLKRTQSNSTTDGKSIKDVSMAPAPAPIDPKRQRKMELMEKRKMDKERQRAQAKSVVAKREMMYNHDEVTGAIVDHESGRSSIVPRTVHPRQDKGKNKVVPGGMALSQPHLLQHTQLLSPPSIDPAWRDPQQWRDSTDDDRSVASSDRRRMSMATVNTVDSDPGPVRTGRQRGSSIGINRATSVSSLRAAASGGGFPRSARSSASFEQFTQEFHLRASVADDPNRMGSLSPGPGGHNHTHWPVPPELPQLVLNGQNRRIPAMSSFSSAMSPESSLRGSLSPASPYEPGPYNQLPSLFQEPPRGHQTLPPFSELVAPLEHA